MTIETIETHSDQTDRIHDYSTPRTELKTDD